MAKDVDLSSKEWRDIVFEGKNKEFGAYVMRSGSEYRHTRAVAIVLSCLAGVLVLLILSITGVFQRADDEQVVTSTEQEIAVFEADEEEFEEEEEQVKIEEPEEIVVPEEVANQQQVTAILVVEDEQFDEEKQVKDQEKTLENEAQFGTMNITDGVDDLNKITIKEQVLEEVKPVEEDKIFNIAMVEQKPEFPGGEAAMYAWLSKNIEYPEEASSENVQGRVVVQFVVSKTGSIENVVILRKRHPALDKEAMRLVKSMPKWQPGRNNGQPVKVTYTLPITFRLQE